MAFPTNTFATYEAIGRREDLSDVIYMVDPTDTPFMTSIESATAEQTLHEWQTDALAAAVSTNQQLEGDDATASAATATVRLSNVCEIASKTASVSNTQQWVKKAGRKDELAYQIFKRTMEIRRDIETSLLTNRVRATGADTVARVLGGIGAWYATNVSRATGGSSGSLGTTAATDAGAGNLRAFSEDLFKDVHRSCWTNGGDPDLIMTGPKNKQIMSEFTGNATRMKTAEDKKLIATIDVYQGDWGDVRVVPNRNQRAREVHLIQTDMLAVAWGRPVQVQDLSVTGDSRRRQVLGEYTLEVRNEKSIGIIADLTS